MSLIAQLLRPAPPLPQTVNPGRQGAIFRHCFDIPPGHINQTKLPNGESKVSLTRVMAILKDGPATSSEIATELCVQSGRVSAQLIRLEYLGKVRRAGMSHQGGKGSPAWVWEVLEEDTEATP